MIGASRTPLVQFNGSAPAAPAKQDEGGNSNAVTPKTGDERKEDGLQQPKEANAQEEARVNSNPNSPPRSPILRPR